MTADNIYIVCDHTDMCKSIDWLLQAYSVAWQNMVTNSDKIQCLASDKIGDL